MNNVARLDYKLGKNVECDDIVQVVNLKHGKLSNSYLLRRY